MLIIMKQVVRFGVTIQQSEAEPLRLCVCLLLLFRRCSITSIFHICFTNISASLDSHNQRFAVNRLWGKVDRFTSGSQGEHNIPLQQFTKSIAMVALVPAMLV